MISRISAIVSFSCILALSACSNGKFIYGKALGDISKITGVETGLEDTIAPVATPAALTGVAEGPPLIVGFEAIRVAIPLAGESGVSKTYASPDGVVIAMNKGFVTRTTGLGVDLNGSYMRANSPWFDGLEEAAQNGSIAERVIEYWELGRSKRDKFSCALKTSARAGAGVLVDETCSRYFSSFEFKNRYWIDAAGEIECSRQWIHPKLAPLQFFRTEQQATTLDLTTGGC